MENSCNLTENRNESDKAFGGLCFDHFASDFAEYSWNTAAIS